MVTSSVFFSGFRKVTNSLFWNFRVQGWLGRRTEKHMLKESNTRKPAKNKDTGHHHPSVGWTLSSALTGPVLSGGESRLEFCPVAQTSVHTRVQQRCGVIFESQEIGPIISECFTRESFGAAWSASPHDRRRLRWVFLSAATYFCT